MLQAGRVSRHSIANSARCRKHKQSSVTSRGQRREHSVRRKFGSGTLALRLYMHCVLNPPSYVPAHPQKDVDTTRTVGLWRGCRAKRRTRERLPLMAYLASDVKRLRTPPCTDTNDGPRMCLDACAWSLAHGTQHAIPVHRARGVMVRDCGEDTVSDMQCRK